MTATALRAVMLALVAVTVAAGAIGVVLERSGEGTGAIDVAFVVVLAGSAVIWAALGAFLCVKRPDHLIGWLLLVGGLGMNLGIAADRYPDAPVAWLHPAYVVAAAAWAWIPATVALVVIIPLVFPTGRPLSRRWRIVGWFAAAAAGVAIVPSIITPLRHPTVIAAMDWDAPELAPMHTTFEPAFLCILLAAALAWVSLALRFIGSRDVERQQLKWFVFAMGLVVAHLIVFNALLVHDAYWIEVAAGAVVWPSVAVAVAIAVLRYRLYEIDRIISRTVGYGLLTVLLVGVYVASAVGLGVVVRAVAGAGGGDVVVAASTLAVAALFGPARRRIQAAVDRRFNRARYDAQLTVEAFAHRLRDEVDLDALADQLRSTASATVQPCSVGLWLLPGEAAR